MIAAAHILGITWTALGVLLVVVGAVLIAFDVAAAVGQTWAGTWANPVRRLSVAVGRIGTLTTAAGAIVLAATAGVTLLAIVVILLGVALGVYLEMANQLHKHVALLAREHAGPRRSWWWCVTHPWWRPHEH